MMLTGQKRILIIGASSGIGKCCAEQLIRKGHIVAIAARRVRPLMEIRRLDSSRVFVRRIDVCNRQTAIKRINELIKAMGGCDIYLHSSGTGFINHSLRWQPEKETIDTNINGFTALIMHMYKYFVKQGHGQIAAITSVAGIRANRYAPVYSSSKAYQIALLAALRAKAWHDKCPITITDIRPGFVDTAMAGGNRLFWVATPQKAAKQIICAIEKRKTIIYITRRWILIGWLMRVLPERLMARL